MKQKLLNLDTGYYNRRVLLDLLPRYAQLAAALETSIDIIPVSLFDRNNSPQENIELLRDMIDLKYQGYYKILIQYQDHYNGLGPVSNPTDVPPVYVKDYSVASTGDRYIRDCPVYVYGDLNIYYCYSLIDLRNTPQYVSGKYIVSSCQQLKTLYGISKKLNYLGLGNLTSLETLEHFPTISSEGTISISGCSSLRSFEGISNTAGNVYISNLDSLENINHFPKQISGNIAIEKCKRLSSLEGIPENVKKDLRLVDLPSLQDISHFPKSIKGMLTIIRCGELSKLSKKDIMNVCDIPIDNIDLLLK